MNSVNSILPLLEAANKAKKTFTEISEENIIKILSDAADALERNTDYILSQNALDLEKMNPEDSRYDRLRLTGDRIKAIADDMRKVSKLSSPKRILEERELDNGLRLEKVTVPFGVIGVIYEARPNVTADVFSLCFKSGNVCVLKGGHDAENSNKAIVKAIHSVLESYGVPHEVLSLLPSTHEATDELLKARGKVDLIIPRGSRKLIENVRSKALVPVIETGAGVCHCYIHSSADIKMARDIVLNAKTRRVSVCNALDCVIIDSALLDKLTEITTPLAQKNVVINADEKSFQALEKSYPSALLKRASDDSFGTEFLGYEMALKTVENPDEAIRHISKYGSGHSESIVCNDSSSQKAFQNNIDAACVYVNAPTSFTDGAQFGMGAEIGISTQKLHARGPMALPELMTYKWLITGNGQVRP